MAYSKAKTEYNLQYAKDNLKRIPLDVPKEKYEEIKAAADAVNEKVNRYIKKAIYERMEREGNLPVADDQQTTPREPASQATAPSSGTQERHYRPFTEADARKIDLQKLLSDIRYQLDVSDVYGMDVLAMLLDKARQQASDTAASFPGNPKECIPDKPK